MIRRLYPAVVVAAVFCCLVSCAKFANRTPGELRRMHSFLTQDDPAECMKYQYNFERQVPRLHADRQLDSILDVIEYIKSECGPSFDLEITRLLLLADNGRFDDSLIGSSTIPQMLWYRNQKEHISVWRQWEYLYGYSQPVDNSRDNFARFLTDLAQHAALDTGATVSTQTLGRFYGGAFDSAFSRLQSDEMRGTALQKNYYEFVDQTKRLFRGVGDFGFLAGSWLPQNDLSLLGNHPDVGAYLGLEERSWRWDIIVTHRFMSAKKHYLVDSLGQVVSTDKFNSWLLGVEVGYKFLDLANISSDIFGGVGYDILTSINEAGDPKHPVSHGAPVFSLGIRQRVFLNQRSGWYLGGVVRYNIVNYTNPRGTDLSGNTVTISLVTGWTFNETLNGFLKKLNYEGKWR